MFLKGSKKKIAEFEGLSPEILEKIPDVSKDSLLLAIIEQIKKFETILKEKKTELQETSCSIGFGQFCVKLDKHADAEELIAGGDIESLATIHPENRRRDILRQIGALETAVTILKERKRERFVDAILETCRTMPPEVKNVFQEIVVNGRLLENSIRLAVEIDLALNKKSVSEGYRPSELKLIAYWREMLFGYPGRVSLTWILEQQEKLWASHDKVKGAEK